MGTPWPIARSAARRLLAEAIASSMAAAGLPEVAVVHSPTMDHREQVIIGQRVSGAFNLETWGMGMRNVEDSFTLRCAIVTARAGFTATEASDRFDTLAGVVASSVPTGVLHVAPATAIQVTPTGFEGPVIFEDELKQGQFADGWIDFVCTVDLQVEP